jgi:hypothetical protein
MDESRKGGERSTPSSGEGQALVSPLKVCSSPSFVSGTALLVYHPGAHLTPQRRGTCPVHTRIKFPFLKGVQRRQKPSSSRDEDGTILRSYRREEALRIAAKLGRLSRCRSGVLVESPLDAGSPALERRPRAVRSSSSSRGWRRARFRLYWRFRSRVSRGRRRINIEIRAAIDRMRKDNPSWGAMASWSFGEGHGVAAVVSALAQLTQQHPPTPNHALSRPSGLGVWRLLTRILK